VRMSAALRRLSVAAVASILACVASACGGTGPIAAPTVPARLSGQIVVCHVTLRRCLSAKATVKVFSRKGTEFTIPIAEQYVADGRFSFVLSPGLYYLAALEVRPALHGGRCISGEVTVHAGEHTRDEITCFGRPARPRMDGAPASRHRVG
jgi:hypothetical protein